MFDELGTWLIIVGGGMSFRSAITGFEPILPPTVLRRNKTIIPFARANLPAGRRDPEVEDYVL